MATEADLIQKFKDLNIPVGADFEELIHAAFAGSNLVDLVNNYDSRITTVENNLATKADDSKVVHDNHDGTEQLNGVQVQPYNKLSDSVGGRNLLPISSYTSGYVGGSDGSILPAYGSTKEVVSDFVPVDIMQSYYCQIIQQVNNNTTWYGIGFYDNNKKFISRYANEFTNLTGTLTTVIRMLPFGFPNISIPNIYTMVFPANTAYVRISFRTYGAPIQASLKKSSVLSDWTPAPEDKVNVADMRKPASDVAGIEEVNAKQDKIGYTPADDSKVAHLSGTNNFDAVPTVNNNPLLLASSLPSDLARTSQQTNFTAGLKSGGVDVATAADLKSVEDSAWRQLDNKYIIPASGHTLAPSTTILYKIDNSNHKLYLSGSIALTDGHTDNVPVTVQLDSIIKSILTSSVSYLGYYSGVEFWFETQASQSSTNLTFFTKDGLASITATLGTDGQLAYVTYNELV